MYLNIPERHYEPLCKLLKKENIPYTVTDYRFLLNPDISYYLHFENDMELALKIHNLYKQVKETDA